MAHCKEVQQTINRVLRMAKRAAAAAVGRKMAVRFGDGRNIARGIIETCTVTGWRFSNGGGSIVAQFEVRIKTNTGHVHGPFPVEKLPVR